VSESTIWNWESQGIAPSHLYRTIIRVFVGESPSVFPLAEQLHFFRWRLGMTQRDLAMMLHVNPSTVEDWETERCRPQQRHQHQIAELLKT
jgi:DNA-binding transcriptional regulator YiaG